MSKRKKEYVASLMVIFMVFGSVAYL